MLTLRRRFLVEKREAHVENFDDARRRLLSPLDGEHQVRRLDIAVHHAVLVGLLKAEQATDTKDDKALDALAGGGVKTAIENVKAKLVQM